MSENTSSHMRIRGWQIYTNGSLLPIFCESTDVENLANLLLGTPQFLKDVRVPLDSDLELVAFYDRFDSDANPRATALLQFKFSVGGKVLFFAYDKLQEQFVTLSQEYMGLTPSSQEEQSGDSPPSSALGNELNPSVDKVEELEPPLVKPKVEPRRSRRLQGLPPTTINQ